METFKDALSEVLFQIHALVEAGHLVAVAIEHEGGLALFEE
jgi:hypothetical protein